MAFVKHKSHPSKVHTHIYIYTYIYICRYNLAHWKGTQLRTKKHAIPCKGWFSTCILKKHEHWVDEEFDKHLNYTQNQTISISKDNDVKKQQHVPATTANRTFLNNTLLYIQTNSLMNMIELIEKAMRFGQNSPGLPNILHLLMRDRSCMLIGSSWWQAASKPPAFASAFLSQFRRVRTSSHAF